MKRPRLCAAPSTATVTSFVDHSFDDDQISTIDLISKPAHDEHISIGFGDESKTLFTRNIEISRSDGKQQWVKGVIKLMEESNDPPVVLISLGIGETNIKKSLTVEMQFEFQTKTTVQWSSEDSQDETKSFNYTFRFKTSKICDEFSKVLNDAQSRLKMQPKKNGKHCVHTHFF